MDSGVFWNDTLVKSYLRMIRWSLRDDRTSKYLDWFITELIWRVDDVVCVKCTMIYPITIWGNVFLSEMKWRRYSDIRLLKCILMDGYWTFEIWVDLWANINTELIGLVFSFLLIKKRLWHHRIDIYDEWTRWVNCVCDWETNESKVIGNSDVSCNVILHSVTSFVVYSSLCLKHYEGILMFICLPWLNFLEISC